MSQAELLKHLVRLLEQASVPYMITGSTVSSLQGAPRTTHDIDVVVALRLPFVPAILAGFPSDRFYVDEDAIRNAIAHNDMFNVLDTEGGDKVDFWMLKADSFEQSMFTRRYKQSWQGLELSVPQPEDTILSKLKWAKLCGGSERQMNDCQGVYEVNYTNLDLEYMKDWAGRLGVADLLVQIQSRARNLLD